MRQVNPAVERVIAALSPTNPYGKPIFRAIWSADRMQWASGWWNDYHRETGILVRRVFESRYVPRYQMAHRWVIERWQPPEFFGTPEMWEEANKQWQAEHGTLLELGPYPHEGDYVWIWTCETQDTKRYIELTPTIAEDVIGLAMQPIKSPEEMQAEADERQKMEDLAFTKRLDDIIGDPLPFLGVPAFGKYITPSSLGTKISEERKRGKQI